MQAAYLQKVEKMEERVKDNTLLLTILGSSTTFSFELKWVSEIEREKKLEINENIQRKTN